MAVGDIALVGYSADTAGKSFSFVILADMVGQTINFTDNGWTAAGGFRGGEGIVSYVIKATDTIGTVVTISGLTSTLNPSTSGDQILAYTGTDGTPGFLFALDFADGNATYAGDATNSNTSAVPPGLTFGDTALAFAADNASYTGPTTGTRDEILANIADESLWTQDDASPVVYASAFTIAANGTVTVSINDVTITEGDNGDTIATFTVTRSAATTDFSVDYGTGGGTASAGEDYDAASGTLTFAAGGALTQTISVTIHGDTTIEPTETFGVTLSNLVQGTGTTTIADGQGTGTITNDDIQIIGIHDVQGSAFFSPILAAEGISNFNQQSAAEVTVRGVVTAIDTQGSVQGFYISEEVDDWDDNALTSEAIFVRTTGTTAGLTVGETVTVTAHVTEFQDFTNLNRTMLTNPSAILQGNDSVSLPTFIIDGTDGHRIPTAIISDDNPDFRDSDGSSGTFDPQNDALDYYETLEGMRVTMADMIVGDGFVGGSNDNFVYFSAYSRANADPSLINDRGGYTITGDPQFYPVDTANPDDDVQFGGATVHDGAQHGDILELDFGNVGRGGTSGFDELLTMGDSLGDVTGILDTDFDTVKLFVTDALDPDKVAALGDTTPIQEVTGLVADDRSLRIASFNVENLSPVGTTFSTNNGVEITTQEKFDKLAANIADNLLSPDIIIIEEVQDNNGVGSSGGTDASQTWEQLIAAVNAATGKTYRWVDEAPETSGDVGGAPGGNIRVGFLYDTARVQLGDLAADATIEERRQYTDRIGDGVRDAGDRIAIDDSQVAGIDAADWSGTRRSIVGEFTFNGQTVYTFGSHLPSKGGSGDFYQLNQNTDAGQPANGDWALRNTLAQDVWSMQDLASAAGGRVVSGGDFNEFWFNRPLEVLTGYANPDGTANTGGTTYSNLVVDKLAPADRFSYDFNGRSQTLDTLLADHTLAGVASYDVVHINTGYNERDGAVNPASSDHDPALASFDFRDLDETLAGTTQDDVIFGFGGDDALDGGSGSDLLEGGSGSDLLEGGIGDDRINGGNGTDAASYTTAIAAVQVSLAIAGPQDTGAAGIDTLTDIENLIGSLYADQLTGDDDANQLRSYGGLDTILGRGGNDTIRLDASAAYVDGGDGTDTVIAAGAISGLSAAAFLSVERLSIRTDALVDLSGLDTTIGSIRVGSEAFDATIIGTSDGDRIVGAGGADTLSGGVGADTVSGGDGADVFAFAALRDIANGPKRDTIVDFSRADGDVIDLSAIDARTEMAGQQRLTYIGDARFTGAAGDDYEVRVALARNGSTIVRIDVDHDAVADRVFVVKGDAPLVATDFVLASPSTATASSVWLRAFGDDVAMPFHQEAGWAEPFHTIALV